MRDPFVSSLVVLGAAAAAGFVAIALAWRGVGANVEVPYQVPYLVSGALSGLGLIGCAVAIIAVQARRFAEAHESSDIDRVVEVLNELVAVARRDAEERPT